MVDVWVSVGRDELGAELVGALAEAGLTVAQTCPAGRLGATVCVQEAPADWAEVRLRLRTLAACWRVAPALVLVATAALDSNRAAALLAGADELVSWPTERAQFAARVTALVRRRHLDIDVNPLTHLPGGAALQRALTARLPQRGELALLACDLRSFKAFNDHYGFLRGDAVLGFVADTLEQVAGAEEAVYHLGGDDFFILTRPGRAEEVAAEVVRRVDAGVGGFYDSVDRERGFITGVSRASGEEVCFPLLSLTVVCATNEAADICHIGQLAQVVAELKEYAKRMPDMSFARDRRSIHDAAAAWRARVRGAGEAPS